MSLGRLIQVSGTLAGGDSEGWGSEDVKAHGQWCQPLPPAYLSCFWTVW